MITDDIKLAAIRFVRSLLDGKIPEEDDVPIFLYKYLPLKIKQHPHLHKLSPQKLEEIPNDFYMELVYWLEKNLGFCQLSDNDLFQKVEDKIYAYLKCGSNFGDFPVLDLLDETTQFDNAPLYSLELPEKPIPKGEIEGIELEKFIANLDPKQMVAKIKQECTEPQIRDWLIQTFPSVEAFDLLINGNIAFLSYLQRRNMDNKYLRKVKRELRDIEIFDRVYKKKGQELTDELKSIRREFGIHDQRINEIYNSQIKKRNKKFGRIKLTSTITLNIIDKDLKASFEQFARQLYLIQQKHFNEK